MDATNQESASSPDEEIEQSTWYIVDGRTMHLQVRTCVGFEVGDEYVMAMEDVDSPYIRPKAHERHRCFKSSSDAHRYAVSVVKRERDIMANEVEYLDIKISRLSEGIEE